jgi:hypothetical protein
MPAGTRDEEHVAEQPTATQWHGPKTMAFRIETAARGRLTIFALSGRIEKLAIEELRKLLEGQKEWHEVVLDLKEVSLVDREVMHFFIRCEADGVTLENCTPYIREWMEREKG